MTTAEMKTRISEALEDATEAVEASAEDVAGLLRDLKEARKALRAAERRRARLVAKFGEVS